MKYIVSLFLESNENVVREIEISSTNSLYQLHKIITKSCDLDDKELASFYVTNDNLDLLREITLVSFEENNQDLMINTLIIDVLEKKQDKLIYVYDYLKMWRFLIELKEVSSVGINNSKCIYSLGDIPKEAPDIIFEENKDNLYDDSSLDNYDEYEEYEE
jgi:hypothetical protein